MNHDTSIGEMIDADDEARIGLLGRDPEIQFVRLAADHRKQKDEAKRLRDALGVIARNVEAGAVGIFWCGDYAKRILTENPTGQPRTASVRSVAPGCCVSESTGGSK